MTALKQKEAREHLMFGWFAEIPSPSVAMIAREQQFAEKVHAFTVPRPSPNNVGYPYIPWSSSPSCGGPRVSSNQLPR